MKLGLAKVLPWLELGLGIGLGLILYLPLHRKDLAEITWIVAGIVGVARIGYTVEMRRELEPVNRLAEGMGLREGSDARLRTLVNFHDKITSTELQIIRDDILLDAASLLQPLANDLTSGLLTPGTYYEWLTRMFVSCARGTTVSAVTTMLESEWDSSPSERRYLEENVAAARRGVTVQRLFVVPSGRLAEFEASEVARSHSQHGRRNLIGYLVATEILESVDTDLLGRLAQGFVVFGTSAALIDITVPPDQARGQVTVSSDRVSRLLRAFEQAKLHAEPMAKE